MRPGCAAVKGAANSPASFVEDMGVDHGCRNVFVAEQFLHRANVIAVFKQMGGEGVTERMAGRPLGDAGFLDGDFHGALEAMFIHLCHKSVA